MKARRASSAPKPRERGRKAAPPAAAGQDLDAEASYRNGLGLSAALGRMNRETTARAEAWLRARGAHPRLAVAGMLACPPWTFLDRFVFRRGFLGGRDGLNLAFLSASATFWSYAKWWHRSWQAKGGQAGIPWPLRDGEAGGTR